MQIFEQQIHKLVLDESEEQEWLVAQTEKNAIAKKLLLSQQILISVGKTALPEKIMSYDEFYRLVPVLSGVLPDLTSSNALGLSTTRKGPRISAQKNSNVQLKFSSERNPLVTKMLHERNEQEKAHAQTKDKKKD